MAGLADLFDPQPRVAGPTQPRNPEEHQGLFSRWMGVLNNPDVKAALVQFGVNALQPVGVGQTTLGHLGSAVGGAAETVANRQKMRADASEAARERQIDLMGLDLRHQDAERQRQIDLARLALEGESQEIARHQAVSERIRATNEDDTVSATRLLTERSKAYAQWQEDSTYGQEDRPWSEYWAEWKAAVGIEEPSPATASTEDARQTGAEVVAAPPGAPPTVAEPGPRQVNPDSKLSANQFIQRYARSWERLNQMLQSSDPTIQQKGRQLLAEARAAVSDPENLTPGRTMPQPPPVPGQPPAPAAPSSSTLMNSPIGSRGRRLLGGKP